LRAPLSEKLPRKWTSKTINAIVKKKKQTNQEQFFKEMTSKCSKPCSETSRHGWWLHWCFEHLDVILMIDNFKSTDHTKIANLLN